MADKNNETTTQQLMLFVANLRAAHRSWASTPSHICSLDCSVKKHAEEQYLIINKEMLEKKLVLFVVNVSVEYSIY